MSHEDPSSFDAAAAHRRFSTECFNRAWELIEKPERTRDDDEAMVLRAMASLWHWTQRPDCTEQNLAIGHWQVSRVYALAGHGEAAMHHAQRSLALALAAKDIALLHRLRPRRPSPCRRRPGRRADLPGSSNPGKAVPGSGEGRKRTRAARARPQCAGGRSISDGVIDGMAMQQRNQSSFLFAASSLAFPRTSTRRIGLPPSRLLSSAASIKV